MIYLASPYSSPDWRVRDSRFRSVCRAAGAFMRAGNHIFSPIAHTHPIALECDLPTDFAFWEAYDVDIINRCEALWILTLDGWRESRGVTAEKKIAEAMMLPIRYVNKVDKRASSSPPESVPCDSEFVYILTKLSPLDIVAAD